MKANMVPESFVIMKISDVSSKSDNLKEVSSNTKTFTKN